MTSPGLSLLTCEKAGREVSEILPHPQQDHVCLLQQGLDPGDRASVGFSKAPQK